jgi:hypothetical protein
MTTTCFGLDLWWTAAWIRQRSAWRLAGDAAAAQGAEAVVERDGD